MRLCVGVTGVKAVDVLGTEFEGRDPVRFSYGGPWFSSHDLDKRNWPETETVLFLFLSYHRPIATSYPTVHGEGGVGAGEPQTGWI